MPAYAHRVRGVCSGRAGGHGLQAEQLQMNALTHAHACIHTGRGGVCSRRSGGGSLHAEQHAPQPEPCRGCA
eukprot:303487-Pelagomonas_calceolata.AAC.3